MGMVIPFQINGMPCNEITCMGRWLTIAMLASSKYPRFSIGLEPLGSSDQPKTSPIALFQFHLAWALISLVFQQDSKHAWRNQTTPYIYHITSHMKLRVSLLHLSHRFLYFWQPISEDTNDILIDIKWYLIILRGLYYGYVSTYVHYDFYKIFFPELGPSPTREVVVHLDHAKLLDSFVCQRTSRSRHFVATFNFQRTFHSQWSEHWGIAKTPLCY